MNADCPHCDDAAAFVGGELPPREQAAFSTHLKTCAACRGAVASVQSVVGRLRAVPPVRATRDLAPLVLARLRDELPGPRRPARWGRVAALAAALAVCAGGVFFSGRETAEKSATPALAATDENAASLARALDWFRQNQEPDGSWDAEKWGGHRRFDVALTALPALALLTADLLTPEQSAAADRAAAWLQSRQNAAGAFGPDFQAAPYNHSIATLALLHAYQRRPDAELKRSLDAALATMTARQTAAGGWGYLHSLAADRSITEWHVDALELARALGWEAAGPASERGRQWLAIYREGRANADEPADSPSRTMARAAVGSGDGAVDFYRAYFLTAALSSARDEASRQRLGSIRQTLQRHQTLDGPEAGSWPADDRWGRAGGRLYSTALASLSLHDH